MFIAALCFATRTSLVLQCLLLGILANGIAKFGLESVLQTADEVQSSLLPLPLSSFLPVPS